MKFNRKVIIAIEIIFKVKKNLLPVKIISLK